MKKSVCVLIAFCIMIGLSACNRPGSIGATGRVDIHYIVTNSVPYVFMGDGMLDFVWEKETDAYGRQLFLYQTAWMLSYTRLDIWVICQKTVEDLTYYYADFCYYSCEDGTPISDAQLTQLKEWNDWGKPLDESKMTSTYCGNVKEKMLDYEYYLQFDQGDKIKERIRTEFMVSAESRIHIDGLGCDAQGNAIVYIVIIRGDNYSIGTIEGCYLARYKEALDPSMIDYISVDEGVNLQEVVHSFRTGIDQN